MGVNIKTTSYSTPGVVAMQHGCPSFLFGSWCIYKLIILIILNNKNLKVMANVTPSTKILNSVSIGTGKDNIKNADDIVKLIGRSLGSPINSRTLGEKFEVTLNGKIEISEFTDNTGTKRKSAKYLTKQGYKVAVLGNFDATIHKADYQMNVVCAEIEIERDGKPATVKFCQQVVE